MKPHGLGREDDSAGLLGSQEWAKQAVAQSVEESSQQASRGLNRPRPKLST